MIFNMSRRRYRQLNAAEGFLTLDMPDHALNALAEVGDPGDQAFEWYLLRAEALRSKKDYSTALECFNEADLVRPDDLNVLLGMAWCQKRIGRVDQSIESMRRAYQSHSDSPVVLYNLACYYSLARNKEQALSWLGRALRMHRDFSKQIPDETDFDPIRDDVDFQRLLELVTND